MSRPEPSHPPLEPLPWPSQGSGRVELDGARGEGGGQILRTALSLSILTGRPFRIRQIRANRDRPGLRPQHLAAVRAAAKLAQANVEGDRVDSTSLYFEPSAIQFDDLQIDVGTAGSTALILHTLHLPIALRAPSTTRLTLTGGTFNIKAPSFPFMEQTWARHMAAIGLPVHLAMPAAGFYPVGGGRLDAQIEPGRPRALRAVDPGPARRIRVIAGTARLQGRGIPERMLATVENRLAASTHAGIERMEEVVQWSAASPGAAVSIVVEFDDGLTPATFDALGERGKPAERVADEAVDATLAFLDTEAALDPHSADQVLLPLALASAHSRFSVSEVSEHLRTNIETIRAFLDVPIRLIEEIGVPTQVHIG